MMFYSFSPPAQSKKVFQNYELLVTEADGLWDLVRTRRVVKVWVSGGHLAELLFLFFLLSNPEHAARHIHIAEKGLN